MMDYRVVDKDERSKFTRKKNCSRCDMLFNDGPILWSGTSMGPEYFCSFCAVLEIAGVISALGSMLIRLRPRRQ